MSDRSEFWLMVMAVCSAIQLVLQIGKTLSELLANLAI